MRPTSDARTLKIIAFIQVLGGVVGAVMTAIVLPQLAAQSHVSTLRLLPWLAPPFLLSLTAGVLLWRGGAIGEILSIINLALQVPVLATPLLSYFFNSGLALRMWIGPDGPGGFVFIGSQFHINFAPRVAGTLIGVNAVAATLLVWLIRAMPDGSSKTTDMGVAHSA